MKRDIDGKMTMVPQDIYNIQQKNVLYDPYKQVPEVHGILKSE